MRIAIDGRTITNERAGVGKYAERVVRALLAQDTINEYVLFLPESFPGLKFPNLRQELIQASKSMIAKRWWDNVSLPQYLAEHRIDLFFSPSFTLPFLPRFADVAGRIPLPSRWKIIFNCGHTVTYIAAIHDLIGFALPNTFTPKMRLWQRFFVSNAVRVADSILASSESTKRDLLRFFSLPPEKNVYVIHLSLDDRYKPILDGRERSEVQQKYSLPKEFILSVGTIEPRKNAIGLARSYAGMPDELRRKYKLVIAGGKGWYTDTIVDEIKSLGVQTDVAFIGYVADEHMPALYSLARLFVFPSLYEGFGFPPLEAMACGVPVITSNTSSLPEVVGDAAILVEPTDYARLALEMEKVLRDGTIHATLREKGLQRAKLFSSQRTAEQTLEVFRKTVG